MEGKEKITVGPDYDTFDEGLGTMIEDVNAGGHKQELDRNFGLLSVSAVGIVSGNTWVVMGGSIVGLPLGVRVRHWDLGTDPLLSGCSNCEWRTAWCHIRIVRASYLDRSMLTYNPSIAASIFYFLITASLAELASAAPSSGGVYHWASITAGKYGRVCGFYAGFWNFLAW